MIRETRYASFAALQMENEALSLTVVPELGGKVASLRRRGSDREWLWRNPHLVPKAATYGESYVRLHDTGGWDECLPTVNGCQLPAFPWTGTLLPDHGEAAVQPWRVLSFSANELKMAVNGVRLPYRLERTLELHEARLQVRYRLENLSGFPLPFLWVAHALLAVEPGVRIEIEKGASTHVSFATREEPVLTGTDFLWPDAAGFSLDVAPPPNSLVGIKAFVGPLANGRIAVRAEDETFAFEFDPAEIPHVALWMNYGAWSGAETVPYYNLGVEPCIGPFDGLDEPFADGMKPPTLPPFGVREWNLSVTIQPS